MPITTLIDKRDTVSLVRDQIAAILVLESQSQMRLAVAQGRDADQWRLRVFTERASPWEMFRDDPDHYQGEDDVAPIVNVWFEKDVFAKSGSNVVERQKSEAVINVDVLGYAKACAAAVGHTPSDVAAQAECERAACLVRNMLMAAEYTYLEMRGTVSSRWCSGRTSLQIPHESAPHSERLKAMRLAFDVTFNELSPQVEGVAIASIAVRVNRNEQGELYFEESFASPTT